MGIETFLIIFSIFFIFLIFLFIFLFLKRKELETPLNAPISLILPTHRTGGHAIGIEYGLSHSKSYANRSTYLIIPRDFRYKDNGKIIDAVNFVKLPTRDSKRIVIPAGYWSSYRDIVLYLPDHSVDLPKKFLETDIGKALSMMIEMINVRDDAIEAIKRGDQARIKVIRDLQTGQLTEDLIKTFKSYSKALVEEQIKKYLEHEEKNTINESQWHT